MPTPASAQPATDAPFVKAPGAEPLPGYRLIEPLGRGGFGEVWKCEAPGGLFKAIKFVTEADHSGGQQLRQEFEAFQRIKLIRHPFMLTLERVERVEDDLIMVMELADEQLHDLYQRYAARGLPGIPREELLGYFVDAAEALDVIAAQHGLQHLDVKPANLFLVGGHVKVGDFGLVGLVQNSGGRLSGLTPRYAAPEVIDGHLHPRSDQYSLALVYQELMTGRFPYTGKSVQQLLLQHAAGQPDLSPLPPGDRPIVARALAKDPAARYPSCLAFVHALLTVPGSHGLAPGLVLRTVRALNGSGVISPAVRLAPHAPATPGERATAVGTTPAPTVPTVPTVASLQTPAPIVPPQRAASPEPPPLDPELIQLIALTPGPAAQNKLPRIFPVIPLNWLTEGNREKVKVPTAVDLGEEVARYANGGHDPRERTVASRRTNGAWQMRFPIRQIAGVARLKLDVLVEEWNADLKSPDPATFIARRYPEVRRGRGRTLNKQGGIELVVRLPDPARAMGEVEVSALPFGTLTPDEARAMLATIPAMLDDVKKQLQNIDERRKSIRVATDLAVKLVPVRGGGEYEAAVTARCRDVSAGGLCCTTRWPVATTYVYVSFPDVPAAAGWAILTRITRTGHDPAGHLLAGRYRIDL